MNKVKTIPKKPAFIALSVLLVLLVGVAGFLFWKRATWRYPYSPETREVLSHSMNMSRIAPPSIKNNLLVSDAVIHAKIISDGDTLQAGDWDSTMAATEYQVKVLETLYGYIDKDILMLRLPGDKNHLMSKPHRNDEVVLFLLKNDNYYALTDMEASIFAIMPDENLYSFEDAAEFSQFDGQPYSQLCEEIAINVEEIKADIDVALNTTVRLGVVLQQFAEEVKVLNVAEGEESSVEGEFLDEENISDGEGVDLEENSADDETASEESPEEPLPENPTE